MLLPGKIKNRGIWGGSKRLGRKSVGAMERNRTSGSLLYSHEIWRLS